MKKNYCLLLLVVFSYFVVNNATSQSLTASYNGKFPTSISDAPSIVNGVLFSQLDTLGGNGSASQQFPDFSNAIIESADEFVVPAGFTWNIDSIDAIGTFQPAFPNGPMMSIVVRIYSDSGNAGIRPGTVVALDSLIIPLTALSVPSPTLKLHNIISLPAGKYWFSMTAIQNFATAGQWFWSSRKTRNAPAVIRDRNNLLAAGTHWRISTTAPNQALAFRLRGTEVAIPPPPTAKTLIIVNDSTTPTAQRTADRDTLRRAVNQLVGGNVTWLAKNQTTVLPDLTTYTTIIFQETGFDAASVRGLVAAQRQVIKDWLATGTPSSKKTLLMIGADIGYAYDQVGIATLDTVFSRTYGGIQWVSDNAASTAPFANVGLNPPGTVFDAMSITPPGGSYWPDGCRPISGGVAFNVYQGRTTQDSSAGIFKISSGFNVISTFQDPRYFTGLGGGTGDMGFKRVLKNMIAIAVGNGGQITGTTPITSVVADKYSLSQNYPNPFNPTTKISFAIPTSGFVSLKVYNITGQEVATLVSENMRNGAYSVDFNASFLSSGIYFYTLTSTNFVETKKMMLVK